MWVLVRRKLHKLNFNVKFNENNIHALVFQKASDLS